MEKDEKQEMLKQLRDMVRLSGIVAIEIMQDKDLTNALAEFYKNLYDALIAKDFSIEAAMRILCGATIPSLGKSK